MKVGAYDASAECIEKIFCNQEVQTIEMSSERYYHFDVVEEILGLTYDEQQNVRNAFVPLDKIDIPTDATLILTQHFANLKILSFEDAALIYQLTFDYFVKNKIQWTAS